MKWFFLLQALLLFLNIRGIKNFVNDGGNNKLLGKPKTREVNSFDITQHAVTWAVPEEEHPNEPLDEEDENKLYSKNNKTIYIHENVNKTTETPIETPSLFTDNQLKSNLAMADNVKVSNGRNPNSTNTPPIGIPCKLMGISTTSLTATSHLTATLPNMEKHEKQKNMTGINDALMTTLLSSKNMQMSTSLNDQKLNSNAMPPYNNLSKNAIRTRSIPFIKEKRLKRSNATTKTITCTSKSIEKPSMCERVGLGDKHFRDKINNFRTRSLFQQRKKREKTCFHDCGIRNEQGTIEMGGPFVLDKGRTRNEEGTKRRGEAGGAVSTGFGEGEPENGLETWRKGGGYYIPNLPLTGQQYLLIQPPPQGSTGVQYQPNYQQYIPQMVVSQKWAKNDAIEQMARAGKIEEIPRSPSVSKYHIHPDWNLILHTPYPMTGAYLSLNDYFLKQGGLMGTELDPMIINSIGFQKGHQGDAHIPSQVRQPDQRLNGTKKAKEFQLREVQAYGNS